MRCMSARHCRASRVDRHSVGRRDRGRCNERSSLTAAPAAHQRGKKCCAAFGGADLLRSRGIARYHFLDRFRTRPVDIILVGAGKQGQPFLARLAPDAAARSCFAVTRLARGLSVGARVRCLVCTEKSLVSKVVRRRGAIAGIRAAIERCWWLLMSRYRWWAH